MSIDSLSHTHTPSSSSLSLSTVHLCIITNIIIIKACDCVALTSSSSLTNKNFIICLSPVDPNRHTFQPSSNVFSKNSTGCTSPSIERTEKCMPHARTIRTPSSLCSRKNLRLVAQTLANGNELHASSSFFATCICDEHRLNNQP